MPEGYTPPEALAEFERMQKQNEKEHIEHPTFDREIVIASYTFKDTTLEQLPDGYAYMGGTARETVQRSFGEESMQPRDQDVVAISEFVDEQEYHSNVHEFSLQYMPDDYNDETDFRYGIKRESLIQYFSTRDFTVNEVLIVGDTILATPQALIDLRDKVIRPTEFEEGSSGISNRIALKAMRLALELEQHYGEGSTQGVEDWHFAMNKVSNFNLALNLNKAIQRGDSMAEAFFQRLIDAGTIKFHSEFGDPEQLTANNPKELAKKLRVALIEKQKNNKKPVEPFLFTRDELNNVETRQDLEEDWIEGEPPIAGDLNSPYEDMADSFIVQKGKHGEGYDEYRKNIAYKKKGLNPLKDALQLDNQKETAHDNNTPELFEYLEPKALAKIRTNENLEMHLDELLLLDDQIDV